MGVRKIYNLHFSTNKQFVKKLRNLLGFVPVNVKLYKMAFRHKSVAVSIKKGVKNSNERLEFLGDAVISSIVADLLFKLYPYKDEGFLTELRAKIVSRDHLNLLSRKIGLNEFVQYNDCVTILKNRQSSIFGDALEALVGAVYLECGYRKTQKFFLQRIIEPHVDIQLLEQTETNFKSRLIEWCQHGGREIEFLQIDNKEKEFSNLFCVQVLVEGEVCGEGQDFNKKNAEKLAAEKACELLSIIDESD